ncbi:MAG: leucine-rich repeat protein [Lachnospiraceae bacterium]|nr:leucine-rich repeat protein [Lachnospiraceae bacterium]
MKKTIAKIMAAAMVLSAVPAVALPTLTAKAAGSAVTIDVAPSVDSGTTATAAKATAVNDTAESGEVGVDTGIEIDASKLKTNYILTVTDGDGNTYVNNNGTVTNNDGAIAKVKVNGSGDVVLEANDTAAGKKNLISAIKDNSNTVQIRVQDTVAGASIFATYRIGGVYNTSTKEYEADVAPDEGSLNSGDIYAQINSSAELQVDVLKGDNKDLDDNDDVRGETVDLNHVIVGGVEFEVTKIGAQALKKAHMKKVVAENVKRVGKGAFRNCKQVKKIDLQDSNKVRKINSKAFYDCKNLNTIIIDGRNLDTVGKDAFHGVKKNCTVKIKAKKSKYESDKKMILKNGGNKNLKFVRK